jgi:hypothetical protein
MTTTTLTPAAKETLRKSVRALRERLLVDLASAARGEDQLDVSADKARLLAAPDPPGAPRGLARRAARARR